MDDETQEGGESGSGSETDEGGYVTPVEVTFGDDEGSLTPRKAQVAAANSDGE